VASRRHRQGPLELGSILLGPFALVPILQLASFVGHMQQFVAIHGGAGSISNSISISIVTCHIDQYCVLRSYRSAISLWGGTGCPSFIWQLNSALRATAAMS